MDQFRLFFAELRQSCFQKNYLIHLVDRFFVPICSVHKFCDFQGCKFEFYSILFGFRPKKVILRYLKGYLKIYLVHPFETLNILRGSLYSPFQSFLDLWIFRNCQCANSQGTGYKKKLQLVQTWVGVIQELWQLVSSTGKF